MSAAPPLTTLRDFSPLTRHQTTRHSRHENTFAESHMSLNPATQNVENLGNSAETLRLGFRAFDLKFFAHDSIGKTMLVVPRPCFAQLHSPAHHANSSCLQLPPRTSACLRSNSAPAARMEQSRNNARAKTPSFTASPPKQGSIDFHFSFARHSRKLNSTGNSRVTIPLTKCPFSQAFHSGIATASGDTFITKNICSFRQTYSPALCSSALRALPSRSSSLHRPPTTHRLLAA